MNAGTTATSALAAMRQRVAHEMDAAAPPVGTQQLGDRRRDAFMGGRR